MSMLYIGLAIWQRISFGESIEAMAGDDEGLLLADDGELLEIF